MPNKLTLGLINWSGHGNLGDDAMARVLIKRFSKDFDVVNFGERPGRADWYILGGELIAQKSLFMQKILYPERTIGISLGVSNGWEEYGLDKLKQFPLLFVRDFQSYDWLEAKGLSPKLSVDLLCALTPKPRVNESRVVGNFIPYHPHKSGYDDPDKTQIKLSPDDGAGQYFTDANELLDLFSETGTAQVTRLHALVLAWLAGVPHIYGNSAYDEKIEGFLERVKRLTPEQARNIINRDLDHICQYLKSA